MRIPYQAPDEAFPINVTNMIDVFLLLLIFFLVATTFSKEERDASVELPGTAAVRPLSAAPRDLVINILQDGTVKVRDKTYSTADLPALLKTSLAENPEGNVLIRADERSTMRYFAAVARECRQAGYNAVKIGYVVEGEPKE